MIEHDCNTAAQQAGYPVGKEHDPDPPAVEQGTGRDLTCQPSTTLAGMRPRSPTAEPCSFAQARISPER